MKTSLSACPRGINNLRIYYWKAISLIVFTFAIPFCAGAQITGPSTVCVGATITLSDAVGGGTGTWTSASPAVATVGSSSGIVSGVTAGTATISYTSGVTTNTKVVTVNPLPSLCTVTGGGSYCAGGTGLHVGLLCSAAGINYQLYNGPTPIGSPLAGTGGALDFGLQATAGTYTVLATNAITGCFRTMSGSATITVNPLPTTISGPTSLCPGGTATLSSTPAGGIWASSTPAVATIGSSSGMVTGVSVGTTTITYTLPTGCSTTTTVTVNASVAAISGPSTVCPGSTITLSDPVPGGVWTSSTPSVATIGSLSGTVTGVAPGTTTITYSLGTLACSSITTITVNPAPAAIIGATTACMGSTITLSDATGGGVWSSSSPSVATVTGAGVVTGVGLGSTTISYTVAGCSSTHLVSVSPTPAGITGPSTVCVGYSITLSDIVGGGIWTASGSSATIGSSSGVVTGTTPGSSTIVYSIGGCTATTTVSVVAVPSMITGHMSVCVGLTDTLRDSVAGGRWSSGRPSLATIDSITGIVTGISSGTVIITYTTGCIAVAALVVNPISPIIGTPIVCVGQTIHLTDTTLGGTWTSSSTAIATVTSGGVVDGVTAGTATIYYTTPGGCTASTVVTVNPLPLPIAGPSTVCVGQTISLSDLSGGGIWSSSNPAVATVDPSGVVTGVVTGITNISYTYSSTTGCLISKTITVNSTPGAISGPNVVCLGSTITLTDVGTGTWSSSAPTFASVDPLSGVVAGRALGSATITYRLGTGCSATQLVNVINPPLPISGPSTICVGSSTLLTDPSGPGTWSSSNAFIASIGFSSGMLNGNSIGTATITYSSSPGCNVTHRVTVNASPGPISGTTNICVGSSTTLTEPSGGTWSSSDTTIARIGATTGVVTGIAPGSVIITFALPTGCSTSVFLTVSSAPAPISGFSAICIGTSASFSDATPGGGWVSSNTGVATVDPFGTVTGVALGTAIISYYITPYCPATMAVTVTPPPSPISGSATVCANATTTFTDAVTGGIWSSSNPAVAVVGSSSGVVTGVAAGTVTIIYTIGVSCTISKSLTVNPVPATITGPNNVCQYQGIILSDVTPGGTWSSSNPAVGSTDAFGDVIGIAPGTIIISYTNGFGCAATYPVTVNLSPLPITGSDLICLGLASAPLHDAVPGGVWSSFNPSVATVGSGTGVVTGVALGTATIIYDMPGNCFVTTIVTVNPLPVAFTVTGGGSRCAGDTGVHIGLSGSAVGVNYLLYNGPTAVGTFPGTGSALDFGLFTVAGTYTVIGTSTYTTCSAAMTGAVLVLTVASVTPSVSIIVSPNDTVCSGATTTFTPVPVNGGLAPSYVWSVNSYPVSLGGTYTYIPANGDVVAVAMTSNTVCPSPATVRDSVTMTVLPFGRPTVSIFANPGDTVCKGTHVTVNAIPAYGGPYPSYAWFRNGAPSGSGVSFTLAPNDGDVVYCVMTSSYPCRLANMDTSLPITMTVDTPVLPSIFIAAYPSTTVIQGQSDTLVAMVSGAVSPTFQWYLNNLPVAGATTDTYIATYTTLVTDSITCVVTSHGVCPVTTFQWARVQVVEGINELSAANDISVLPNPNKGEFTIKGTLGILTDDDVYLQMTDMLGRVVYNNKIVATNGKLNTRIQTGSTLANGMYILSLRSGTLDKVFHIVIEQ